LSRHADLPAILVIFDVDNTLLDTDLVVETLRSQMAADVGKPHADRFWALYELVRESGDAVNVPETLERFAQECADLPAVTRMSEIIYGFDFSGCVFPGAFPAIDHAWTLGGAAILSDGDQLWQRHKITAAGLDAAVHGQVMVQKHKELEVARATRRFPARHYAVLDDKLRLLSAMKQRLGATLTTVHVCQGKYADARGDGDLPADISIASIAEFPALGPAQFAPR
jgi:FMN phosphatase YigB (HAD superfamily)